MLPARGSIIGLLALEHHEDRTTSPRRDVELLKGFVEPVALAIDNARWFGRLRTVGADEERTRIARDLHDRIGQSLAYLAFELDRHRGQRRQGRRRRARRWNSCATTSAASSARSATRSTTCAPTSRSRSDIADDARGLRRPAARAQSTLEIELYCDRGTRLPILQEREMWRIAQEALINVERHASATRVEVLGAATASRPPSRSPTTATGFPEGKAGRLDSYGILGMRERARRSAPRSTSPALRVVAPACAASLPANEHGPPASSTRAEGLTMSSAQPMVYLVVMAAVAIIESPAIATRRRQI